MRRKFVPDYGPTHSTHMRSRQHLPAMRGFISYVEHRYGGEDQNVVYMLGGCQSDMWAAGDM